MIRAALILAFLLAPPALADTVRIQQSDLTLRDTAESGAAAEILFENSSQDDREIATLTLVHGAITCTVDVAVGGGEPDSIVPECEGLVAVPRSLTIVDGTKGVIYLYAGAPMM